jgi:hypothetical protein
MVAQHGAEFSLNRAMRPAGRHYGAGLALHKPDGSINLPRIGALLIRFAPEFGEDGDGGSGGLLRR